MLIITVLLRNNCKKDVENFAGIRPGLRCYEQMKNLSTKKKGFPQINLQLKMFLLRVSMVFFISIF